MEEVLDETAALKKVQILVPYDTGQFINSTQWFIEQLDNLLLGWVRDGFVAESSKN